MASDKSQSLETIIQIATNPLNKEDDPNAIQAVCHAINADTSTIPTAVRLIAHKIQSPQERESLQALSVLQACVNNCGMQFHSEIGKFRFLNEMIKLVSPKYMGSLTPISIKTKVVELLFSWTVDLKEESKIIEAYNMLKKQNVVKDDPAYVGNNVSFHPKPRPAASFEDEEKSKLLQRLLQSKSADDLQKANALIKSMVKEDERRMERCSRRIVEVETALNNVRVLDDMLTRHQENDSSSSDLDLMKELNASCLRLQTGIYRLVAEMDEKDDGIGELLKANDELSRVTGRYKLIVDSAVAGPVELSHTTEGKNENGKAGGEFLLDLATPEEQPTVGMNIADVVTRELQDIGLGGLHLSSQPTTHSPIPPSPSPNPLTPNNSLLYELGDIFASPSNPSSADIFSSINSSCGDIVTSMMSSPLVPQNVAVAGSKEEERSNPLADLDLLGSSLLKKSLPPNTLPGAQFKAAEKMSMNKMKQLQHYNVTSVQQTNTCISEQLDSSGSLDSSGALDVSCLLEVDLDGGVKEEIVPASAKSSCAIMHDDKVQLMEVKSLMDVKVSLESIRPGTQSPLTIIDCNDIKVVLHFALNKPRDDVSVLVASTLSSVTQPITNYVMQAIVPKGCKARLLQPSSTELPSFSPFLPCPAITQIILIANPNQLNVSLKLMLSYAVDDDSITEMGEVERLPL